MGLFDRSVKIGEQKKFDIDSVSTDGVTQEKSIKNKIKLKELFKAFDLNKDGTLDKMELALAMDAFSHYDEDNDGKISSKELNEAVDQAEQRQAAVNERKAQIARTKSLKIPNKTYNTYEDYVKELFKKEGIEPTRKEIQDRIAELKKLNPSLKDGELLNKTIITPFTENFGNDVLQRRQNRQDKKEIADYTKKRYESGKIAQKLFDICDNNMGGVSTKEFKETMAQVNADNIVEILNKYDQQAGTHKGDTSLMDTIRSDMSNIQNEKQALTQIINNLSDAAKKAGVSEDDIKKAKDSYLNSMNEEYSSIHTVNPKDMEKSVDFLRGAIEAKRRGKDVPKMGTSDAMKSFMYGEDGYTMANNSAQTEYADARKGEGWTAKTGDWVCGLFGCNTIDDMDKKLGKNAQGAHKLLEAAKSGNEAEFKKVYKDMFGVEFDENKIAARNAAKDNLNKAVGLNSTVKICNSINTDSDYSTLRADIRKKMGLDDETVDAVIKSYADSSGMKAESEEDKKSLLAKFVQDTKSGSQKELDKAAKGRTLEQMGKDLDLLTKSAYGTNDIVKDVIQFNENQETTEMATTAAFEIAGTVALQFVPGLGQMAAQNLLSVLPNGVQELLKLQVMLIKRQKV